MSRVLERAGARLRSRAGVLRDTLRNVPSIMAAAHLGPSLIADAGLTLEDLIGDGFEGLGLRYATWAEQAQSLASGIVAEFIGEFRSSATMPGLAAAQAAHLRDSTEYLAREIGELARIRLFDAALIQTGELVPAGFVRAVTAIAGGTTEVSIEGGSWVALTAGGTQAVPGIATGPDIMDALRDEGAGIPGYRWVYGPAQRGAPFPPHVRLDGVTFTNFDDPKLANPGPFPPYSHFLPGDHAGCRCDYEPILIPPPTRNP